MDTPGEYYINKANGTLYFYPPKPLAEWTAESVELTVEAAAMNVSGCHFNAISTPF